MTQYAFYLDATRCTGCKTCEMACKDYRDLDSTVAYRRVYDYEGGDWTDKGSGTYSADVMCYHVSISCNHCGDPACTKVCPTGAMHKDAETGLVSVDAERCIGCGYCHMACPYNAPKVDRSKGHSVKCDGCVDRLAQGLQPICVAACPLRALQFGTVEEMAKLGDQADIAPLPTKGYTDPHLYIKAPADAQAADSRTGRVLNVTEVS